MNNLKDNIYFKGFVKYTLMTLFLLLSAINFNLFMKPVSFVTGGIPGLSIIIEHLFGIPTNYFMYAIYFLMFILSFIILGKKSMLGVLYATIFYPTFVSLTSDIIEYVIIDYNDFFLLCLFSGIISGVCNGMIYKMGFASSGLGVLGPICNKCFHYPIATTNFVVNTIIVLVGGYFFGLEMVLYAIIFLYLNRYVSNKIILGISSNKAVFIRSEKLDDITKHLYQKYGLEATILDVFGGYSNQEGSMSLVVIPSIRYNLIINEIKIIDKNIFYNVLDGYELQSKTKNQLVS